MIYLDENGFETVKLIAMHENPNQDFLVGLKDGQAVEIRVSAAQEIIILCASLDPVRRAFFQQSSFLSICSLYLMALNLGVFEGHRAARPNIEPSVNQKKATWH